MYSVVELRQLVASTIQENPDTYSEAVLEQKRDAYCEWITMESSWGGGIELGIFANFFDMEVCLDIKVLRLAANADTLVRYAPSTSRHAM
jgi:OTU-like cysteine protease